jgi:hypothetical protein
MRDNPLENKVLAGGSSFGPFAFEFYSPGLAQIAQEAGAEFILYDMEHSGCGIDVQLLQSALSQRAQAMRG